MSPAVLTADQPPAIIRSEVHRSASASNRILHPSGTTSTPPRGLGYTADRKNAEFLSRTATFPRQPSSTSATLESPVSGSTVYPKWLVGTFVASVCAALLSIIGIVAALAAEFPLTLLLFVGALGLSLIVAGHAVAAAEGVERRSST